MATLGAGDSDESPAWQPLDGDGDGVVSGDNCPGIANADQADADAATTGDACDVSRREKSTASSAEASVSTDDGEHDGATADDPLETIVQTGATPGPITIVERKGSAGGLPGRLAGRITAPDGTVAEPLRLTFLLDASLIPAGTPATAIAVTRNGVPVADCLGGDPCVDAGRCSRAGTPRS